MSSIETGSKEDLTGASGAYVRLSDLERMFNLGSRNTANRLAKEVGCVKVAGRLLIKVEDLEKYLASQSIPPRDVRREGGK